jgi:hypothetical protein
MTGGGKDVTKKVDGIRAGKLQFIFTLGGIWL